jgi:hypothetical protein
MSSQEDHHIFTEDYSLDSEIQHDGQEIVLLEELYKLQAERSQWGNADPIRLTMLRKQIAFTYFCLAKIDEKRARRYTPAYDHMQAAEPYRTDSLR